MRMSNRKKCDKSVLKRIEKNERSKGYKEYEKRLRRGCN